MAGASAGREDPQESREVGFRGPRLVPSREAGCSREARSAPCRRRNCTAGLSAHCLVASWARLKAGGEGATEDEMAGRHHRLNGHEFEQTPGAGDGQGGLACCSPWDRKESDTTERLN